MAAKSKSRGPLPRKPKASNDADGKIRLKLGVSNRVELVLYALSNSRRAETST